MRFGVFIYDGVEPIDLATVGVLSMARRIRPDIEICTLAPAKGEVRLSNGLVVLADHALAEAPTLDALIVTGGPGCQAESRRPETLAALRRRAATPCWSRSARAARSPAPAACSTASRRPPSARSCPWSANLDQFPPLRDPR